MDYIEGQSLSQILTEHGAQAQELVIDWAKQICEVLYYLHTRTPSIIYRDMKPANIMLKPDGSIILIDFGIAREYKEENISDTISLGTKGYAAPEQFGGKGQTDVRTDIYSLGITMYHLITGHNPCEPPYEIYPIRHWNQSLAGGLEKILEKCTQLNPDDRYQSCAELIYALHNYEEEDESFKRLQRKKLNQFILLSSLTAFFFILGIVGQVIGWQINTNSYDSIIAQGERSASNEQSEERYIEAIQVMPNRYEGYLGLVSIFKDDAVFTLEEEEELKNLINPHLIGLRSQNNYDQLAFEIGKLYWYYYNYGKSETTDNQLTRMKSANQWFQDVVSYGKKDSEYFNTAKIYYEISKFNKEITLSVEEASDKGQYINYWTNINELIFNIDDNESEIVRLEMYKLFITSVETYARKFKADGVTKDELLEAFNVVKEKVNGVQPTTEKTEGIKEKIIARIDPAYEVIINSYR